MQKLPKKSHDNYYVKCDVFKVAQKVTVRLDTLLKENVVTKNITRAPILVTLSKLHAVTNAHGPPSQLTGYNLSTLTGVPPLH